MFREAAKATNHNIHTKEGMDGAVSRHEENTSISYALQQATKTTPNSNHTTSIPMYIKATTKRENEAKKKYHRILDTEAKREIIQLTEEVQQ